MAYCNRPRLRMRWLELLIVGLMVVVMISILLPLLNDTRGRISPSLQSISDLRQVGIGFYAFSVDNGDRFPGVADGGILNPSGTGFPFEPSLNGASVEHRFAELLTHEYFDNGNLLISPFDRSKVAWTSGSGRVSEEHYSYALLRIHSDPTAAGVAQAEELKLDQGARSDAWISERGSAVVMFGDRAIRRPDGHLRSIQTRDSKKRGDDWQGGIGWGDGHATQESSYEADTSYPGASAIQDDHLFRTDQGNATVAVPGEGPWDEVMDNANAVLDAVGSSAGVEATRMTGE